MTASFRTHTQDARCTIYLCGDWKLEDAPDGVTISEDIPADCTDVVLDTAELGKWDSSLAIAALHIAHWCDEKKIPFNTEATPEGLQKLLNLATAVPANKLETKSKPKNFLFALNEKLQTQKLELQTTLIFVGDVFLALGQWLRGNAKTRNSDIAFFVEQAGPKALAIVTLISFLVGMILAYLGSVQLRQLGAQVYVANLVSIGMVREMGALMTAIIMAGRTGAAYAAQIGTMKVNEEIDALQVMGISSMEFLVLPRMLALIFIMPLLCIYADIIGMIGGGLIATSMDVSVTQYILQTKEGVDWLDISTGLIKSLFFGILIAIAGCQAGLNCGRNSTAVGLATTSAVVKAIVYLVVADAAFNILYDKLGI